MIQYENLLVYFNAKTGVCVFLEKKPDFVFKKHKKIQEDEQRNLDLVSGE